jgi:hypothetical protein
MGAGREMKFNLTVSVLVLLSVVSFAQKSYKHASEYEVGVLDESTMVGTGTDATLGKTATDAKLGRGGQGFHFLHTDDGNYRVEAPINTGMSILSALGTPKGATPVTMHNQWFLDKVPAGTNVLFDAECAKPNKKHPDDTRRCAFWFPDPDSTDHEYRTMGDFTPYMKGDGSNTQKTANVLCGTGKLKPETEKKICNAKLTDLQPAPAPPVVEPTTPAPPIAAAPAPAQAVTTTPAPASSVVAPTSAATVAPAFAANSETSQTAQGPAGRKSPPHPKGELVIIGGEPR